MGTYRSYTTDFKESSLLLLQASGYPEDESGLTRTAKHLGIPPATLNSWRSRHKSDDETKIRTDKRLELTELLEAEMRAIFEEMNVKREGASYRDLGIVGGIILDKLANLNGDPSQIIQQQISFNREGVSTLPQHLAPLTIEGNTGEETV